MAIRKGRGSRKDSHSETNRVIRKQKSPNNLHCTLHDERCNPDPKRDNDSGGADAVERRLDPNGIHPFDWNRSGGSDWDPGSAREDDGDKDGNSDATSARINGSGWGSNGLATELNDAGIGGARNERDHEIQKPDADGSNTGYQPKDAKQSFEPCQQEISFSSKLTPRRTGKAEACVCVTRSKAGFPNPRPDLELF